MMSKLKYLLRSVANTFQKKECPFCGSADLTVRDRKYLFTVLYQCNNCFLNHRHPKDNEQWLRKFYQSEYSIDTHMMTQTPSAVELKQLKAANFDNLRNLSHYIFALTKSTNIRVLDYGCSWGYSVFQFNNYGFHAHGYELSKPRAGFGTDKLNVSIATDERLIPGNNDVIISSHVIEHLFSIERFVKLCSEKLKADGLFMAFCPNGSREYEQREPGIFHVNWGAVHPNYLTPEFAKFVFKDNPYYILTGDWEFDPAKLSSWDGKSQVCDEYTAGKELLIVSKPNLNLT